MYDFYEFCKINKPPSINSIKHTCNEFRSYKDKLPQYIKVFFNNLDIEIDKATENNDINKIKLLMEKVNNKENFLKEFKIILEKEVDIYLEFIKVDKKFVDF